eukprot:COSAG01_NODE_58750_length_304_cov_0.756098_1_plen_20_part_10
MQPASVSDVAVAAEQSVADA